MSTRHDDLLTPRPPERLAYADGGLLTAELLTLEQRYHRARLGRLLAYLHGAGTVAGLDVGIDPAGGGPEAEIRVRPGLALDRLGRLIELDHDACLRLPPWFDQQVAEPLGEARIEAARRDAGNGLPEHIAADVYIAFELCSRSPQPAFATGNADQMDGVAPSRLLELARLSLLIRESGDDRLPRAALPALGGDAAALRDHKRTRLWDALRLQGDPPRLPAGGTLSEHRFPEQDGSEVFLARLRLPVARDGDGVLRFDPNQAPAVEQDGRVYSYAAAELAWLHGLET